MYGITKLQDKVAELPAESEKNRGKSETFAEYPPWFVIDRIRLLQKFRKFANVSKNEIYNLERIVT